MSCSGIFSLPGGVSACEEAVKPAEPGGKVGWPELGWDTVGIRSDYKLNSYVLGFSGCAPVAGGSAEAEAAGHVLLVTGKVGNESFWKRNMGSPLKTTAAAKENPGVKKVMKVSIEQEQTKITEQRSRSIKITEQRRSPITSKNSNKKQVSSNSTAPEYRKRDYIHVRARRGEATDSHSLAERVRREKISERMKFLQDLVPDCNKVTGKAGMLDEIINYVQSLQHQVEFLSMKLATVSSTFDININNLLNQEVFPGSTRDFSTMGLGLPMEMANSCTFSKNPMFEQLEMVINPDPDSVPRRTISVPLSIPEMYLDRSCFTQTQEPPTWDTRMRSDPYNSIA